MLHATVFDSARGSLHFLDCMEGNVMRKFKSMLAVNTLLLYQYHNEEIIFWYKQ